VIRPETVRRYATDAGFTAVTSCRLEHDHDVSVDRSGAGGIRRSLRIRRIVDAPTR
jgi:hypothetical protein